MLSTSRIVLIGLLALMQLIAPLVHAHASGGGVTGFPHLPELEVLAHQPTNGIEASAGEDREDLIVSVAPGLKSHADRLTPGPDPETPADLPGVFGLTVAYAQADFPFYPPPPERDTRCATAGPRAPPGANFIH